MCVGENKEVNCQVQTLHMMFISSKTSSDATLGSQSDKQNAY